MSLAGHSPCKRRGLDIAMVVPVTTCENRFVLAQKMFHPSGEMRKVPQGNGNGHGAGGLLQPSEKRTTPPPPASAPASELKESRVMFQTHDGLELQGVPVRVTRHHVVFELYNPGMAPRLSEAINEFVIILQTRTVYSGRAVVRNVVDAGSKMVCDASLDEARWLDLSADLVVKCDDQLVEEFNKFVKEWQKLYRVLPEFKEAVTDIEMFLTDLRIW